MEADLKAEMDKKLADQAIKLEAEAKIKLDYELQISLNAA